eukprot:scaffold38193_cov43-Attheya_sp.AAC.1
MEFSHLPRKTSRYEYIAYVHMKYEVLDETAVACADGHISRQMRTLRQLLNVIIAAAGRAVGVVAVPRSSCPA